MAQPASDLIPRRPTLPALRRAAASCQACDLWQRATQTVFGEGATRSRLMLVGEQPGNDEDLAGRPFVGPAGRLLERSLEAAGIPRDTAYVTNVVKHFKWTPRSAGGSRRIHAKPNAVEIAACRPWLQAELEVVRPHALVCLGSTAAQALLGRDFRVSRQRGEWVKSPLAPYVMATVHPSSILRAPDDQKRHEEMARFVDELRLVSAVLAVKIQEAR